MKIKKVIGLMNQWAPLELAAQWDNVGIQCGSSDTEISKILITLTVTNSVIDKASSEGAGRIIAHHPMYREPIGSMEIKPPLTDKLAKLIKHDITVFAAHTNLDVADGGVNDCLADILGIENRKVV